MLFVTILIIGLVAAVFFLTTQQKLRQRKGKDIQASENDSTPQEDIQGKEQINVQNTSRILYIIAIILLIIFIVLVIIYLYLQSRRINQDPYPPFTCTPLTLDKRIQYFNKYKPTIPFTQFSSPDVKKLFRQGFGLSVDFNRIEAAKSFELAIDLDPLCGICYWGLAYARGPFINYIGGDSDPNFPVFDKQEREEALKIAQKAGEFKDLYDSHMGSYVDALIRRYTNEGGWLQGEIGFAEDMLRIHQKYPDDVTSLMLAVEANMTSSAWDYYDQNRKLKPQLQVTYENLKRVLEKDPQNLLALHLGIHLTEEHLRYEGMQFADALADVPNLPYTHLIHMPTHTYIRVGRYYDAYTQNYHAQQQGMKWAQNCIASYVPEHNVVAGLYGASMAGAFEKAEELANLAKRLPYEMPSIYQAPGTDWTSYPLLLIRYAKWMKLSEILDTDLPNQSSRGVSSILGSEYSQIVQYYGYIMYMSAISEGWNYHARRTPESNIDQFEILADRGKSAREVAIAYLDKLRQAVEHIPLGPISRPGQGVGVYMGSYKNLSSIYLEIAEARLSLLDRDLQGAISHLKQGVEIENSMGYIEPPRLYQSVRQCLGFVLQLEGKLLEAKEVLEQDLEEYPLNGWALRGLINIGQELGEDTEELKKKFQQSWRNADFSLQSSCPAFSQ